MSLEDTVLAIVEDLVAGDELFTALDVSNKVKEKIPFARHKEVRDIVRNLFQTGTIPTSYATTLINVSLTDGSKTQALLYHPISDSWDLDQKYDEKKRAQVSVHANVAPSPVVSNNGTTASVSSDGTISIQPPVSNAINSIAQSDPSPAIKTAWNNLFNSQPSLFPRKA